jgi:hypothetical protein
VADLLRDAIEALGNAAQNERSMRIGHEVAEVLYLALREREEPEPAEPAEPAEHEHYWSTLGWDRPDGGKAAVVQACGCGAARELEASRAT